MAPSRQLSSLRDLETAAGELAALSRALCGAAAPDRVGRGRDAAELVTVTVDGRGCVQDLKISPNWARNIGESRLGSVILEAYRNAILATLTAIAQRIDTADLDHLDPDPSRSVAARFTYGPTTQADLDSLREEVYSSLDRAEALAATQSTRRTATLPSPRGVVRVTIETNQITNIAVRSQGATSARTADIEREARSVLQMAERWISTPRSEQ
jgi:hypothetical protein